MNLGPCCSCEKEDDSVRNLLMLHFKAPIPGTGWGCFVCHLPSDGALAVLCDGCIEDGMITQIVSGYPADGKRKPFGEMDRLDKFDHDMKYHPEEVAHLN